MDQENHPPAGGGLSCPKCGKSMICPHCGQAIAHELPCSACGHVVHVSRSARLELEAGDWTPVVGGWTDVAPLEEVPAHELPAGDAIHAGDWDRVAAMPEFKTMMARKARFVLPATIFFIVYYFALPVLVGYAPRFMERKVFGAVNLAYLFALSQFFMAWGLAFLYFRVAGRFDAMSEEIIGKLRGSERANAPAGGILRSK